MQLHRPVPNYLYFFYENDSTCYKIQPKKYYLDFFPARKCDYIYVDDDACRFKEVTTNRDTFSWKMQNGPTPTKFTGPPGDHTNGYGWFINECSVVCSIIFVRVYNSV